MRAIDNVLLFYFVKNIYTCLKGLADFTCDAMG